MDEHMQKLAFSSADFLEIWLNLAVNEDGNLSLVCLSGSFYEHCVSKSTFSLQTVRFYH